MYKSEQGLWGLWRTLTSWVVRTCAGRQAVDICTLVTYTLARQKGEAGDSERTRIARVAPHMHRCGTPRQLLMEAQTGQKDEDQYEKQRRGMQRAEIR